MRLSLKPTTGILLTLNLQIDVSETICVFYEDRHGEQQCEVLVVLIMECVMSGTRSTNRRINYYIFIALKGLAHFINKRVILKFSYGKDGFE
jgi:hypothetical protein